MTTTGNDTLTVGDLMTGDLVTLSADDTVASARELLGGSGFHAVPVLDADRAVGVLTLADCEHRLPTDCLGDAVRIPPVTIGVDASVAEAAALMRAEYLHHLLVTEGTEPIGILSTYDLLSALIP